MLQAGAAVLLFVAGGLAGWIGHSLAAPPDKVGTISVYEDWRLACPALSAKDGSCALAQDIMDSRTGSDIAKLAIGRGKTGLEMIVTGPLDMLIQPGMGVALGSDKIRVYPYQTCTAAGCVAIIPVDGSLMSSMRSTNQGRLLFVLPNTKPVGLPFSLKGFVSADDAWRNEESRRKSWWRRLWS